MTTTNANMEICADCNGAGDDKHGNSFYEDINPDGPEAADLIDTLVQALDRATAIIQSERDSVVECATVGQEHDLSTLDPGAEHAVAEFDYDLAHFNAALAKARGENTPGSEEMK